jgi:hypothetical protein
LKVAFGATARYAPETTLALDNALTLRLLAGEPVEMAALPEIARLRLGVVASNPGALDFWRKLGYRETGEVKAAGPGFVREVIVLEKPISRTPAPGA